MRCQLLSPPLVMSAKAVIQDAPVVAIAYGIGYSIAWIIKLVLGLTKPDPSAGR